MIKVGINGFGAIGKRVACSVRLQDDMELVGVAKVSPDCNSRKAIDQGFRLFCSANDCNFGKSKEVFSGKGLCVGTLPELLEQVDVIVDTSPGGYGERNKENIYNKYRIKTIFQGGESPNTGFSFNARTNYGTAAGKDSLRVVSCNTTGILRILTPLGEMAGIREVFIILTRRAADPKEDSKGPMNSFVPTKVPSHHAVDVNHILPKLNIITFGGKVPMSLMHQHSMIVEFDDRLNVDDVIEKFRKETRVALVGNEKGNPPSSAAVMEMARDIDACTRNDIPNIILLKDTLHIVGNKLIGMYYVHQESDVVPENIDAIRACMNSLSREESMKKTDDSMNLGEIKKKMEKYFPGD